MAAPHKKTTQQLKIKSYRQEELRNKLAAGGHIQHVTGLLDKLEDETQEIEHKQIQRLKIVIDTKMKFIDKYLPNLKAIELSGEIDQNVKLGLDPIQARAILAQYDINIDDI